jgi:hypothetical protein
MAGGGLMEGTGSTHLPLPTRWEEPPFAPLQPRFGQLMFRVTPPVPLVCSISSAHPKNGMDVVPPTMLPISVQRGPSKSQLLCGGR